MNIQEYIESGELELYAAGGLTEVQRTEVERMARENPSVQKALQEACLAMENYALQFAQTPNPEVEERIIQQLFGISAGNEQASKFPVENSVPERDTPVLPLNPVGTEHKAAEWRKMAVAAGILLLISIAANLYLFSNWREAEKQLALSNQTTRQYALEVSQLEQRAIQSENVLTALRNPETETIRLKGVGVTPNALATVYWNRQSNQVLFDAKSLPAPPAGKQYQLWSLNNGKPADAGVVSQPEQLLKMKAVEDAQAFAVTLEPAGGSANPTLEAMVVMGEI